ncbi:unnamed protein product [Prorocentrum cordatum]|uniref:Uncharacterized protein n=1 Tax=Prorocentrum cordatum TaxID=2364126 RepID=A0ABN9VDP2_9DINO|nr:unnamed protein product [Polarella glacialis]
MASLASVCSYEEASESEQAHMKKCRHIEIKGLIVVNPVVFLTSCIFLWGFVIACCVEPDYMKYAMDEVAWGWIPEVWTWIYIISQDIWVVVLLWAMYAHGSLKLGKDEDEPEFSTATWFSMLFCCGVATGLFYYAVAEPMWHYKGWGSPRFISGEKGYGTLDEDATHALMVSVFHWGLHGWIPYVVMGAVLAIMTYRRGYPMTVRYAFVPLIGDHVYGWMGDCVDALSIVTSIAGVCTSLGLGAMSINAGLQRLSWGSFRGVNYAIPDESRYARPGCNGQGFACKDGEESFGVQRNTETQILAILIITSLSTVSVVLGIGRGIKFLSQCVFAMGTFLMLVVALNGETYLILDNIVQVTGYYLWYIQIGFHCDAWERLGGKDMGLGGVDTGGGATWIIDWTIFYWGWWISWGPFVGTFIARISKGRTLRVFILSTLIVPTLYSIVWFCVWGTEGIRMQRMADTSGLCTQAYAGNGDWAAQYDLDTKKNLTLGWTPACVLDDAYHGGYGRCKRAKFTSYVDPSNDGNGKKCVKTTNWVSVPCGGAADPTFVDTTYANISGTECANYLSEIEALAADNYNQFPVAEQQDCFVPLQDGTVCLYNRDTADILFDQISSYAPRGYSDMLCALTLIILTFYFVTSSDSGSFVVDMLASNGHPDPPMFQRVFWSFTEGATAIALLYSGINHPNADASLKALQAASIITGLPYTFVMFWATQSLVILVQEESGALDPNRKAFTTFIFNMDYIVNHLKHTAVPGIQMARTVVEVGKWPFSGLGQGPTFVIWCAFFSLLYYASIIITICSAAMYQWALIGCALYIGFGTFVGLLRNHVRVARLIKSGDLLTDLMCGLLAPMFTLTQIEVELQRGPPEKKDDPAVDDKEI